MFCERVPATAWLLFQRRCDRTKDEVRAGIVLARKMEVRKHLHDL